MAEQNEAIPPEKRIEFRVGINLGDVIAEGEDIFGDGVNVAARLEALAEPGGVFISNTVYDHVRDRLSFGFEDLGEQSVKNIARPVRVYRVRENPASPAKGPGPASPQPLPVPDKPSIAVLPFANMSGDPEQEYFADGMVEEIITALSRIRWFFVIARNSSFTYKGQAIDVKQVGRELGVRYVLQGSVRKAGTRVRITGQLIDALSGTHLWADRFDGSLEDVFDLQDTVASSVAGVIEPALRAAETARSAGRPTNDLTAYDLYLRAYALVWSSARQSPQALRLMEQTIERDPHYGPALAWAAYCCYRLLIDDRSEHRGGRRSEGRRFRNASPGGGWRRRGRARERRPSAGLFRRGHRRHDSVGRSCTGTQPEFRARLACQRHTQVVGGPARHRDKACRSLAAPQSPRPHRHVGPCNRRRAFRQPALR